MLTKKKVSELTISRLSGGAPSFSNKIDEREVWVVIDAVIASLVDADYRANIARGSYDINGAWIKTFEDVQVKESKSRKEFYIDLPAYLTSLPQDRAIRMITPMEDQSTQYTVINNNSIGVFANLEAGGMERTCYIEGAKVYFPRWSLGLTKVLVKMIPSTDALDEDEMLPMPGTAESMLLEQVYAKFKEQSFIKEKKINDSNANTP